MDDYKLIKRRLINGEYPDEEEIVNIVKSENIYRKSMIIALVFEKLKEQKCDFLKDILAQYYILKTYLLLIFSHNDYYDCGEEHYVDEKLVCLLKNIIENKSIGIDLFSYAMSQINNKKADPEFISIFLIEVYTKGLSDNDISNLALAMCSTGSIYNYRKRFENKKVVRRYPTGAVSEKTALILPSMFLNASKEYRLVSPFLIAKSLSFTGGTWDKLSAIPGFKFPNPGDDTCDVIHEYGVAMTVAHEDLCPVDTIIYQIRSMTETVDSIPLAAASIASKQLACPPDVLLLDVRYGKGAFFNAADSRILSSIIEQILTKQSIEVMSIFTDTNKPGGSSIGNQMEICEAISIMKNSSDDFDMRLKKEQMDIIATFYAKIMDKVSLGKSFEEWHSEALLMVENGILLASFKQFLRAHSVSEDTICGLLENPMQFLNLSLIDCVYSYRNGKITAINQKKLGDIVNFGINIRFGVDLNRSLNEMLYYNEGRGQLVNLLLKKSVGDTVLSGEPIVEIYSNQKQNIPDKMLELLYNNICTCFEII